MSKSLHWASNHRFMRLRGLLSIFQWSLHMFYQKLHKNLLSPQETQTMRVTNISIFNFRNWTWFYRSHGLGKIFPKFRFPIKYWYFFIHFGRMSERHVILDQIFIFSIRHNLFYEANGWNLRSDVMTSIKIMTLEVFTSVMFVVRRLSSPMDHERKRVHFYSNITLT